MKFLNSLRATLFITTISLGLLSTAYAEEALKMELTANKAVKDAEGKITYVAASTVNRPDFIGG